MSKPFDVGDVAWIVCPYPASVTRVTVVTKHKRNGNVRVAGDASWWSPEGFPRCNGYSQTRLCREGDATLRNVREKLWRERIVDAVRGGLGVADTIERLRVLIEQGESLQ